MAVGQNDGIWFMFHVILINTILYKGVWNDLA
jgi:hypothetical protein